MSSQFTESGSVSPICRCNHYKDFHHSGGRRGYGCDVEGCVCPKFDEIPFAESDLGACVSEFLQQQKEQSNDYAH